MKKLIFLLFILIPTINFSQSIDNATYRFLDLNNSAQTLAMGGVNISLSSPANIFENPALINEKNSNFATFSYINYLKDINWGFTSYVFKPSKIGNFATGIQYINYGEFIDADEIGNINGTFRASDYVLNVAWSYKLDSFLSIGVNLKPVYSTYEIYTSLGIATDLGLLYSSKSGNFNAGIVFKNIGTQLKPYTTGNYEKLPFDIQIGFSQKMAHAPLRFSIFAHHLYKYDLSYNIVNQSNNNDINENSNFILTNLDLIMRHLNFSADIIPSKSFYLTIGFNYKRRQELKITSKAGMIGFSGGVGLQVSYFNFNYAISNYYFSGNSHTFTFSLNLNKIFRFSKKQ